LAFATERFSTLTFDPSFSILVVTMVVVGGLGSVSGAILGALYLLGLPAIFGSTPTIQFLIGGLGVLAFILYLPSGLADVLHRFGDLSTTVVQSLGQRYFPTHFPRDPGVTQESPGAPLGVQIGSPD
jgi:hypothetical protein